MFIIAAVIVKAQHHCIVAEYPFNGNANDVSGNNYNGTVYGPVLDANRFNVPNTAYLFDATDDYIEVADPPNGDLDISASSDFSISVWIKSLGPSGIEQNIVNKKRMVGGNFFEGYRLVLFGDSGVRWQLQDVNGFNPQIEGSSKVMDNLWHHVVAIRDGANSLMKLYVDGQEDATPITDNTTGTLDCADPLWIGKVGFYNEFFNGAIDDVKFFDCVLDPAEVDSIYNYTPVGIKEKALNTTIDIYPNPTTGQFTVQGAIGTIEVHDLFGRLVLTATEPQLDMSAFPKGVYIVRAGQAVRKLVLN